MYDPNAPEEMDFGPEPTAPPSAGGDAYSPFDQPPVAGPGPMDTLKNIWHFHGKKIIAILAVLIVGFFIYDFFIGSLVSTTLEARNTESGIVGGITGMVFAGNDSNPIETFSGSLTLNLRPGDYRVEWSTSGTPYSNRGEDLFTVLGESKDGGQTEKFVFTQDVGVKILNLDFPSVMVAGQTDGEAEILLQNTTGQTKTVELVFEDALPLFSVSTQPAPILIPANGTLPVKILMNVPSSVAIKDTRDGDAKKATVRVKFTNEKRQADFTLYKSFEFSVSPSTNVAFNANANELESKKYAIRNRGNADAAEGIQAAITIKGSPANLPGDIVSWFSWSIDPPFGPIGKGDTFNVDLRFNAPITAASDTIEGEVRFFTSFWEQTVPFTVNLVESAVEVVATVDGSKNKTFNLTQDPNSSLWDSRTATLRVQNDGELPIATVLYTLEGCTSEYVKLVDESFFPLQNLNASGQTNSSKSTTIIVTAPITQVPNAEQFCQIKLTYLDPKTGDVGNVDPVLIRIVT